MSLRLKLAVSVGVIVASAIAAAAGTFYLVAGRQLNDAVDVFLHERADSIARGRRGPGPSGPLGRRQLGPLLDPDAVIQFIDAGGDVNAVLEGAPAIPVSAADLAVAAGQQTEVFGNATINDVSYRTNTMALRSGGAVQVARDVTEIEAILAGLRLRLLLVGLGGTAIAAALGWLVASRTVAPVETLTKAAEDIASSQDLSTPIPVKATDEVGRLAGSFNVMLDALEASRRQQHQLVMDASHELRTPLTSLRANIEVLQRAEAMEEIDRKALLEDVVFELGELTTLVAELVELAAYREPAEEPERVVLSDVAERAVERALRRNERKIDLAVSEAAEIEVRPTMIERAVANLISNAVKFSDSREPIEVEVTGRSVEVRDRGPGIPEADRKNIFDRFYRVTTTRSMPGSGLGLAIVKQIVESHGGEVWAKPRDDGPGSAVGFRL